MIKWKCKECVGLYCIRHKGNSTKWILGGITNRHQRKEKFKSFWHFEIIRGYSWFRLGISPWLRFKIFWEFMLRGNVCANISAEKKDVRTGVFRSNGDYLLYECPINILTRIKILMVLKLQDLWYNCKLYETIMFTQPDNNI